MEGLKDNSDSKSGTFTSIKMCLIATIISKKNLEGVRVGTNLVVSRWEEVYKNLDLLM